MATVAPNLESGFPLEALVRLKVLTGGLRYHGTNGSVIRLLAPQSPSSPDAGARPTPMGLLSAILSDDGHDDDDYDDDDDDDDDDDLDDHDDGDDDE